MAWLHTVRSHHLSSICFQLKCEVTAYQETYAIWSEGFSSEDFYAGVKVYQMLLFGNYSPQSFIKAKTYTLYGVHHTMIYLSVYAI